MTGAVAAIVDQIAAQPATLGLGNLTALKRSPAGALLLADVEGALYVVDVQAGPADDRQIIRLVERWAAVRRRYAGRRCAAVVVAEEVPERLRDILSVITKAVPLTAVEIRVQDDGRITSTSTDHLLG